MISGFGFLNREDRILSLNRVVMMSSGGFLHHRVHTMGRVGEHEPGTVRTHKVSSVLIYG